MRRAGIVAEIAALAIGAAIPALGLIGDSAGVGSNVFTTAQLNAPTLDSATALLCQITLTWTAPATGAAPDGYDVYRGTVNGGPYSFVKHVGVVTLTIDTGLSANTTYYYVLRSTRASWTSANANQRSATTALVC